MKVLVLGGTVFLGRALVEALTARGHAVTTLTRGVHPLDGAPPASRLIGDREGDLSVLPPDGWDAIVDTSGYRPRVVRASAERLARAGRYAFVSTISVYDATAPEIDEDSPVPPLPEGVDEKSMEAYGPLKAQCEAVVEEVFGEGAFIVRPGLLVGPYDPTDRFTYWPERAARGGTILAPAPPEHFVQFVDVRDAADFIVRGLEEGTSGVFNVTGEPQTTTMRDVIDTSRAVADVASDVVWVGPEFLALHAVEPWTDLPLWIPESAGMPGFDNASVARARAHGLTFLPLERTVRDTLEWARTRPADAVRRAGISAEREAELLTAWLTHA